MGEEASVGMSLLVGFSAYFLDDSQIVSAGIYGKSFLVQNETLVIVDKLLRHLTEATSLVRNSFSMNSAKVLRV